MSDFIGVKIALVHNNELLVIQRDDKPGLRFAGLWDFAGGGREGRETPEECVIREVAEELGLNLSPSRIAWKSVHPAMHDSSIDAYFMVAAINEEDIANIVFGDEGQGWKMMSIDEFMKSEDVVPALKGRLDTYLQSAQLGDEAL